MIEQRQYFAEELDQIHQIYIKTSYGNIFAYAVGQPGQPLIIVVHGSGPRNSADQYQYLLHQYLVRVSYIEKFFIVAIDCPGYGRSKGSKQAVKTFPLQMFKQILKDLGYKSYFGMFGHSQGGAAIFNAVFQDPTLTQFLLMDRPVCGNIKRFSKFPIPTLLVYDIQDDGHPVWQGKLLYKQLLSSEFYTYRNSKDPFWVPDNIWNLIISLFKRYSSEKKSLMSSNFSRGLLVHRSESNKKEYGTEKQKSVSREKKKHLSTSKYQQIKKEREREQKNLVQIKEVDKSQIYSKVADLEQLQDLPTWMNQPKVEQTEQQIRLEQEMRKKKEKKLKNEIKIVDLNYEEEKKQENKGQSSAIHKQQQKKQVISPKKQKEGQKEKSVKHELKLQQKQLQFDEERCSICCQSFYFPVETNCKHIFCKKCIGESMLVNDKCPLCRTLVTKRVQRPDIHQKFFNSMSEKDKERRQRDLNSFEQMLKSIVYIQIGNNSRELACKQSNFTKTKKKYIWELYAKEPKNFYFEQVSFDINMGNRDSTPVRVNRAPFVFESRGTFSFSCEITIKPKNKEYAPITSVYRIEVAPGNHSKTIAVRKKKF